jgi:hypothetical protein
MTGREVLVGTLALATWGALLIMNAELRPATHSDLSSFLEPNGARTAELSDRSELFPVTEAGENVPSDSASLPSSVH